MACTSGLLLLCRHTVSLNNPIVWTSALKLSARTRYVGGLSDEHICQGSRLTLSRGRRYNVITLRRRWCFRVLWSVGRTGAFQSTSWWWWFSSSSRFSCLIGAFQSTWDYCSVVLEALLRRLHAALSLQGLSHTSTRLRDHIIRKQGLQIGHWTGHG